MRMSFRMQKGQPAMRRLRFLALFMGVVALVLSASLTLAQTDEPAPDDPTEEPIPATPEAAPDEDAAAEDAEAGEPPAAEPEEAPPAEYVSARRCFACHRDVGQPHFSSPHALTVQDPDEEVIVADFEQAADLLTLQLPGADEARPVTVDDLAFVVGTGTYAQQYVVAEEGEDGTRYWVLPALWDATAGAWQPWRADETWPGDAFDWTQQCAGCHTTGLDVEAGEWLEPGVHCEACHGPGSHHLMALQEFGNTDDPEELAQIRASIVLSPDAQICGACHSQGEGPDDHPYPVGYLPGGSLLARDVFEPYPPDDEGYWWPSGHGRQKYMQFNEWLNSGHPRALQVVRANNAAEDGCLVCHSADAAFTQRLIDAAEAGERPGPAPEPASLETARFGVTCSSCHVIHLPPDEGDDAANPFMLTMAAYEQCTACHQDTDITAGIHHPVMEMFEGIEVVDEVDGLPSAHFTSPEGPKCVTCHMPRVPVEDMGSRASHTFHIVEPGASLDVEGLGDSCSVCHIEQASPAALQALIDDIQSNTQDRINAARDAIGEDTPEWVVRALDFVEGDGSRGVHNYAYTDRLLDAIELELGLDARPALAVTPPPEEPPQPTPTIEVVSPEGEGGAEQDAAPDEAATEAVEE